MDAKVNSFGLYDAPVRVREPEDLIISPEEIEDQLDNGAFFMNREEAVKAGFLCPYDEQDTRILNVGGQK